MRVSFRLALLTICVLSVGCTAYDPGMREWQGTIRSTDEDAGDNDAFESSTNDGTGGQPETRDSELTDADGVEPDVLESEDDPPSDAGIMACDLDNATTKLVGDQCVIDSCEQGYGNCDGYDSTGCEKRLDDTNNCGACGVSCGFENATASCFSGVCVLESCNEGFDDCNNNPIDGCETSLNSSLNCGACDNSCPTLENGSMICEDGVCTPGACYPGWDSCDDDPDTLCETRIDTTENCGSCGHACDSKTSNLCRNGYCVCGFIGGQCAFWEWCCSGLCLPRPCLFS